LLGAKIICPRPRDRARGHTADVFVWLPTIWKRAQPRYVDNAARVGNERRVAAGAPAEETRDPAIVGGDRRIAAAAPLVEARNSIVGDGGVAGRGRATRAAAAGKNGREVHFSAWVDSNGRMISGGCVVEKEEPIVPAPIGVVGLPTMIVALPTLLAS
jgi:hypothetical protein